MHERPEPLALADGAGLAVALEDGFGGGDAAEEAMEDTGAVLSSGGGLGHATVARTVAAITVRTRRRAETRIARKATLESASKPTR